VFAHDDYQGANNMPIQVGTQLGGTAGANGVVDFPETKWTAPGTSLSHQATSAYRVTVSAEAVGALCRAAENVAVNSVKSTSLSTTE
jgi:hypothetical protein